MDYISSNKTHNEMKIPKKEIIGHVTFQKRKFCDENFDALGKQNYFF